MFIVSGVDLVAAGSWSRKLLTKERGGGRERERDGRRDGGTKGPRDRGRERK